MKQRNTVSGNANGNNAFTGCLGEWSTAKGSPVQIRYLIRTLNGRDMEQSKRNQTNKVSVHTDTNYI